MPREQHVPTNASHTVRPAPNNLAQHEQMKPQAAKAPAAEKPRMAQKPPQEPQKAPEKVGEHGDDKKAAHG